MSYVDSADPLVPEHTMQGDERMEKDIPEQGDEENDAGDEVEGDRGVDRRSDDSSEEEEEDEEAERRVREGFIVDEDEEEDDDDDDERRRRRKRRKHKHRRREDVEEDLDEDDLELLEENTGGRVGRSRRLTRLRRGRDSESPAEASRSKRREVVESSDDDLDEANILGAHEVRGDIQNIWDDDRGVTRDEDEDMDMDDFIDDEEDEEEGAGAMAEEEREERRRERRRLEKERRQALSSRPELTGIDANAWDEIHDVFGDGHDYDWALAGDDEEGAMEDTSKQEMRYQDVFEPSEIKARLLTEDDDLIRAQDIPERMQLATSTMSSSTTLSFPEPLSDQECMDAAGWVTQRLPAKEEEYFKPSGAYHHLLPELVKAVNHALDYVLTQYLEVPYIYAHRRDYVSHFQDQRRLDLLSQNELWSVYMLGQKYRSLIQRQRALHGTYERLGVVDGYYEDHLRPRIDSVESVADVTQWLGMKYKRKQKEDNDIHFHDDDESLQTKKHKLPSRVSAYEVAKRSIVSQLADKFGIRPQEVVMNFVTTGNKVYFADDQDLPPAVFAEGFADSDSTKALPAEELLRQARMILSTELGLDPLLRQEVRKLFKTRALITVQPTDRGKNKIDDYHQYNSFKYLLNKPVSTMMEKTQFLHILAAESQHLITVTIFLPSDVKQMFQNQLNEAFASDSFSDTAKAWNEERALVVQEAVEKHLLPVGVKWTREFVRETVEENLASHCANVLFNRINVLPYQTPELQKGETPSVCSVSWGKGDPKKDEVSVIILDDAGRLREHAQFENLQEPTHQIELLELVKRRKPDVIVVGGFSIQTTRLVQDLKKAVRGPAPEAESSGWGDSERNDQFLKIPIVYVHDDVARIYQHSKRAEEEFSSLPMNAKYCVGLARYTQSPLNEFAALGQDITAITFDEEAQTLVPKEKLLFALERSLVDIVNRVGVDINRAVNDPYYAHLLPYIAGLGPRKAQVLTKKIASMGGNLVNREQFIKSGILTTKIFMNAAGFLRIAQDSDYKEPKNRNANFDWSNSPDPLDDTRIHPEDYELARKMATDALELDEEDVHDEHPSYVVSTIMRDEDNVKKLDELNLEDFAISMEETNNDLKRHTLGVIRNELIQPFGDLRQTFILPNEWEVLMMLTGETARTLSAGSIVSVLVLRIKNNYIIVRLDSGIEGVINAKYLADQQNVEPDSVVKRGQTIQGVIIEVKLDLEKDQFSVELSSRPSDVALGDATIRRVKADEYYDAIQAGRDYDLQQRKKRAELNRTRRVIKHPNFHNFNSAAAETYLEMQHPGDVVIRPSSKGPDHLAVTWKIADNLFQHIDVHEPNADPTGQVVGGQLIVDSKHEYADLDELIVNHVQAMARRVEELMAHEKFKKDEDELNNFLTSFVAMNPSKSIYGFTLDRKHPGHFHLSFLAKKGSTIQTWPVRVSPEAYYLFNASVAGVLELCDAFKLRHLHESQNMNAGGVGGKTPYGAGRMTPARTPGAMTPGRMTPGHMSTRQPARTPNPYSASVPSIAPFPSGSMTPASQSYGYQTPSAYPRPSVPSYPSQPSVPSGMHPGRAAMLQNAAGSNSTDWVPGGGRW